VSQRRSGPCGLFSRAEDKVKLSDDEILLNGTLYAVVAHVKNKFERKTKKWNFLPSEQKAGRISRTQNRTTKCLSERERENFNQPFLHWHFSPGDKIENCPAQFLAVRWIVRVEFKVHRLRDGFSVSNALLLGQSLPAFIGHNLDKIGEGTVL